MQQDVMQEGISQWREWRGDWPVYFCGTVGNVTVGWDKVQETQNKIFLGSSGCYGQQREAAFRRRSTGEETERGQTVMENDILKKITTSPEPSEKLDEH